MIFFKRVLRVCFEVHCSAGATNIGGLVNCEIMCSLSLCSYSTRVHSCYPVFARVRTRVLL